MPFVWVHLEGHGHLSSAVWILHMTLTKVPRKAMLAEEG